MRRKSHRSVDLPLGLLLASAAAITGCVSSEEQTVEVEEGKNAIVTSCTDGKRDVCHWHGTCSNNACVCDNGYWKVDDCNQRRDDPDPWPGNGCKVYPDNSGPTLKYCNNQGRCNSTGDGCICFDGHYYKAEKCSTYHEVPEAPVGMKCYPGDRTYCKSQGKCDESNGGNRGQGCVCDDTVHRVAAEQCEYYHADPLQVASWPGMTFNHLTAASGYVFWSVQNSAYKVPRTGGGGPWYHTELVDSGLSPVGKGLAADGNNVYWSEDLRGIVIGNELKRRDHNQPWNSAVIMKKDTEDPAWVSWPMLAGQYVYARGTDYMHLGGTLARANKTSSVMEILAHLTNMWVWDGVFPQYGVSADGNKVCWMDGGLKYMDLSGTARTPVSLWDRKSTRFCVPAGNSVYVIGEDETLFKVDIATKTHTSLWFANEGMPMESWTVVDARSDASSIYVAVNGVSAFEPTKGCYGSKVLRIPMAGGTPYQVARKLSGGTGTTLTFEACLNSMAVDDQSVYWSYVLGKPPGPDSYIWKNNKQ